MWVFTKEEPQKSEKPRVCLQTLDRLREFCSDSNQQCTRAREDGFQGKGSLSLEKCPSLTGRSSELKNPSWDTGPKVTQKVCRDLALWCVGIACYELNQQALAPAPFCAKILCRVITEMWLNLVSGKSSRGTTAFSSAEDWGSSCEKL